MEAILIPVKRLGEAKQRLSGHFTSEQRVTLGLAMLADILAETRDWRNRFIVTADDQAAEVGRALGCHIIEEHEGGLNLALSQGTEHAGTMGVRRLLTLPADVPAVSRTDLRKLFSYEEEVVIAPSLDGGTTALLRTPPGVMETAFGPGSAQAHLQAARRAGLTARKVKFASLVLDVDTFRDLQRLAALPLNRRSVKLARQLAGRDLPPAVRSMRGPA